MKRAIVILVGMIAPALGQAQGEFTRGKVVELYIGYSVGGGYDVYARLLARHMGRHLPGNPVVVPRNMEGAGRLRLPKKSSKAAPRESRAVAPRLDRARICPRPGPDGTLFKTTQIRLGGSCTSTGIATSALAQ